VLLEGELREALRRSNPAITANPTVLENHQ
jgi:hypothetical protein